MERFNDCRLVIAHKNMNTYKEHDFDIRVERKGQLLLELLV